MQSSNQGNWPHALIETKAVRTNRALLESYREFRQALLQAGEDADRLGSSIISSLRIYAENLERRLPENGRLEILHLTPNPSEGVRASVDVELTFGEDRCVMRVEALSDRTFKHDAVGEYLGDAFKDRLEVEILQKMAKK